jgi:hypothetical protein
MNSDRQDTNDAIEPSLAESVQADAAVPQTTPNPARPPRKRKGIFDRTKPLDSPEDEAIAQYLATPKSIREFKSITELAAHFKISRMTVYRWTKDPEVLQRAEWLLTHHRLAGDLIARLHWERIVAGQVKAAIAGDTKAAQFCKEQAWPEVKDEGPFGFPFK